MFGVFFVQVGHTNHARQAAIFRSKWCKRRKSQPPRAQWSPVPHWRGPPFLPRGIVGEITIFEMVKYTHSLFVWHIYIYIYINIYIYRIYSHFPHRQGRTEHFFFCGGGCFYWRIFSSTVLSIVLLIPVSQISISFYLVSPYVGISHICFWKIDILHVIMFNYLKQCSTQRWIYPFTNKNNNSYIIEGSLEVKLPTIWTVEKQRWKESEEKRSEERRGRCAKR